MKEIGNIIKNFEVSRKKANSERAELIQWFVDELNEERKKTKYPDVIPAQIAVKLSHLKTKDLYTFKSQCQDRLRTGYPLGKYFWGVLKVDRKF
jgi:hypothetical protein